MEFNKYQIEAINSSEPNIIVVAPAGAGKTSVLIETALLYRKMNPNDVIDVITYTRAATEHLKTQFFKEGVFDINVSTIHVWSRERLNELGKLYGFKVRIMEEPYIKEILKDIVFKKKAKVNPDILYSYITGNKKMDVSQNYLRSLAALESVYINFKRDNGLYDFTDYPLYLLEKLQEYDEKIYRTDAFFVDELQDVDDEQAQIFGLVEAKKKFFIGDERQAIYIFRGADAEVFTKFDDFNYKKLKINYRSYQEIIDFASTVYDKIMATGFRGQLISDIKQSQPSQVKCDRGPGGDVFTIDMFGRAIDLTGKNKDQIRPVEIIPPFYERKAMILCRTNKQVKEIEALGYKNVSTIHQAKGLEYDDVILIDTEITIKEDLNVAYVGMTRAKNNLLVTNFKVLTRFLGILAQINL